MAIYVGIIAWALLGQTFLVRRFGLPFVSACLPLSLVLFLPSNKPFSMKTRNFGSFFIMAIHWGITACALLRQNFLESLYHHLYLHVYAYPSPYIYPQTSHCR